MLTIHLSKTDIEEFKWFLNSSKQEYIDILCTKYKVIFISNSLDFFMSYSKIIITSSEKEERVSFRLHKKTLSSLIDIGYLCFSITDAFVNLDFSDDSKNLLYSFRSERFLSNESSYLDKIGLSFDVDKFISYNFQKHSSLIRVAKNLNENIQSFNNYLFINNTFYRVYQKCSLPNFSINADNLSTLMRVSSTLFDVRNYMVAVSDNIVAFAMKNKNTTELNLEYIESRKKSHVIKSDLSSGLKMCKKVSLENNSLVIDFSKEVCYFEKNKMKFTSKCEVKFIDSIHCKNEEEESFLEGLNNLDLFDESKSLESLDLTAKYYKHKIPIITLPSNVITQIFSIIHDREISTFIIKKDFILVEIRDIKVLIGR